MPKFWEENFLRKYNQIFEESSNSWIQDEYLTLYSNAEQKYLKTESNYKKNHNKVLYGFFCCLFLPLSLITIIPFYWVYKKFKALRKNKNDLLSKVDEALNEKSIVHNKIINSIDFNEIFNQYKNVIKYQHCGPIVQKLIDMMQELSLFDLSTANNEINPYTTSWSIIDENKIALHIAKQHHKWFNKTYSGSKTVYYQEYDSSSKSTVTRSEVVTAYYTHPAIDINDTCKTYTFMESCSNLEFNYDGKSGKFRSSRYNKRNNYSPLENKKFDDEINWSRNDEVQFRMVFTPLAQENYLLESNNAKDINDSLKWSKWKCFMTNQHTIKRDDLLFFKFIKKPIDKFSNNAKLSLKDFKTSIHDSIISYYYSIYSNANYIWMLSLMQSENHNTIINNVLSENKIIRNNYNLFGFNILNQMLKKDVIKADTNTFHMMNKFNLIDENNQIAEIEFEGITYDMIEKVTYISTYAPAAGRMVSVPVHYIDYIEKRGTGYTYSIVLDYKNNYFYDNHNNIKFSNNKEFDFKMQELKEKYQDVVMFNGIVSIFSQNKNSEIINDLRKIVNYK